MTIAELLVQDIEARAVIGMKRYGRPLEPGDLEAALQNAFEECLDQAFYLKQALETLRLNKERNSTTTPTQP